MVEMDEIVEMVEIGRHFAHFARATSLKLVDITHWSSNQHENNNISTIKTCLLLFTYLQSLFVCLFVYVNYNNPPVFHACYNTII